MGARRESNWLPAIICNICHSTKKMQFSELWKLYSHFLYAILGKERMNIETVGSLDTGSLRSVALVQAFFLSTE